MAIQDYSNARRLGLKAYRQDMSAGRHPYLKVLDELLPFAGTAGETDLGLIEIPIEQIVGTKTSGRTKAFAGNFMPLLNESSEFAAKWSALYRSHLAEGIREPVLTYGKDMPGAIEIGSTLAASVITSSENVCPRFMPEELGLKKEYICHLEGHHE